MQCPRCHAENRQGRRFCGECGLSFAIPCPACGSLNEGGERFAYRASRRTDDAARLTTDAVRLATERQSEGNQARALLLLGESNTDDDPVGASQAEDCCRRALAIAEKLGMRPLGAHCHAGLARLYQRIGRREQAQQHLVTATRMYREMDMQFWLGRAEAETNSSA